MTILKVRAGDTIKARTMNAIIDAVNRNNTLMSANPTRRNVFFSPNAFFFNESDGVIIAGTSVSVAGMAGSVATPTDARLGFIERGFALRGPYETEGEFDYRGPWGILLAPARPGRVAPCYVMGSILTAMVAESENPNENLVGKRAKNNKNIGPCAFQFAPEGDFIVIGRSEFERGKCFAYLFYDPLVITLGVISGNMNDDSPTAALNGKTIHNSLLKNGDNVEDGDKVVAAFDKRSGLWELIESNGG